MLLFDLIKTALRETTHIVRVIHLVTQLLFFLVSSFKSGLHPLEFTFFGEAVSISNIKLMLQCAHRKRDFIALVIAAFPGRNNVLRF